MANGKYILHYIHYVHLFLQLFFSVVKNYEDAEGQHVEPAHFEERRPYLCLQLSLQWRCKSGDKISWNDGDHVIATEPEPSFGQPEVNVSVVEGDMAVLPCSIKYLGDNQVAWTDSTGFVLTHQDRRIIEDPRLSVERPFTKDWNLHIRDVKSTDTGKYICQINTQPAKKKTIALYVQVPPTILDNLSSSHQTAREGNTVNLTCNATGKPAPTITWFRITTTPGQVPPTILDNLSSSDQTAREGNTVNLTCNATGIPAPTITWFRITTTPGQGRERIGSTGEVLKIYNVSRDCGGVYVCEADNGIDDKASRKIKVNVEYAPEVEVKNSRMGHFPGRETFLQCEVVANPHGVMYWYKEGKEIVGDARHIVEMFNTDYDEKKILSLRIRAIDLEDFGRYTCFAQNKIGLDKASMVLYDYSPRVSTTPIYIKPLKPIYPETTPEYINPTRNKPKNRQGIGNTRNRGNVGAVTGNKGASSRLGHSNTVLLVLLFTFVLSKLNRFSILS